MSGSAITDVLSNAKQMSPKEIVETAVAAGIQAIPLVGGSIAAILDGINRSGRDKIQQRVFELLEERIARLEIVAASVEGDRLYAVMQRVLPGVLMAVDDIRISCGVNIILGSIQDRSNVGMYEQYGMLLQGLSGAALRLFGLFFQPNVRDQAFAASVDGLCRAMPSYARHQVFVLLKELEGAGLVVLPHWNGGVGVGSRLPNGQVTLTQFGIDFYNHVVDLHVQIQAGK